MLALNSANLMKFTQCRYRMWRYLGSIYNIKLDDQTLHLGSIYNIELDDQTP